MSLSDEFGKGYTQEQIDKFGNRMLDKYGLAACRAAEKVETQVKESSAKTYKPQIRQLINRVGKEVPEPEEAAEFIKSSEKQVDTKRMMFSAVKAYYLAVNRPEYVDKIDTEYSLENPKASTMDKNTLSATVLERIGTEILPKTGKTMRQVGDDRVYIISLEHKALFYTIYATGYGANKLCMRDGNDDCVEVSDLDTQENAIKVPITDGDSGDTTHDTKRVGEDCMNVITKYLEQQNISEGPVFNFTSRTALNRLAEIEDAYKSMGYEFENVDKLTPTALANS
jgi:hypothetical protein